MSRYVIPVPISSVRNQALASAYKGQPSTSIIRSWETWSYLDYCSRGVYQGAVQLSEFHHRPKSSKQADVFLHMSVILTKTKPDKWLFSSRWRVGRCSTYYLAKKYMDKIQYSSIYHQLVHLTFVKYDFYLIWPFLASTSAFMRLAMPL